MRLRVADFRPAAESLLPVKHRLWQYQVKELRIVELTLKLTPGVAGALITGLFGLLTLAIKLARRQRGASKTKRHAP